MGERAPYSRIYWTVRNDPRLADIYSDDRLWATWTRLLLTADMAWPAPADLPGSVRKASVEALVAAGVIELLPGGLFTFHGLDTERGRRQESARTAAGNRWQTERSPNGVHPAPERNASRDETRRDEGRRDETSRDTAREDNRPDVEAFLAVRMRLPTPAQRDLMDAYVRVFDETGPARAAQLIYRHPEDPIGALKTDMGQFRDQRKTVADAEEQPKAPRRKAPTLTGVNAELAKMFHQKAEEDEQARLELLAGRQDA